MKMDGYYKTLGKMAALPDEEMPLLQMAFLLGRFDTPALAETYARLHFKELELKAHELLRGRPADELSAEELLRIIGETVFEEGGYVCSFEDASKPFTLNILQIAKKRRLHPFYLNFIYLYLLRALHIKAGILSLPRYFLIQIESKDEKHFIADPIKGGKILNAEDLKNLLNHCLALTGEEGKDSFRPLSNKEIILKIQEALKEAYMGTGNQAGALKTLQTMLILDPTNPFLWLEDSFLQANQNNIRQAILSLETYLVFMREKEDANTQKEEEFLSYLKKSLN